MSGWQDDRVQAAIDGRNPTVVAELGDAFAVIGDVQFLPGYSVAITKRPGVDRLTDLTRRERLGFLADVDLVATAVETVCARHDDGYRRVNVEILGNTDAFLHCHIWPRYEWEPAQIVAKPVWLYDPAHWSDPQFRLDTRHDALRRDLTDEVIRLRDAEDFSRDV